MKYRECDNCGIGFNINNSIKYDKKVFCSKECLITYMYKKIIELKQIIHFLSIG